MASDTEAVERGWRPISGEARKGQRVLLVWGPYKGIAEHVELGSWKESISAWTNTYGKPFSGEPDGWAPLAPFPNPDTTLAAERDAAIASRDAMQAANPVIARWVQAERDALLALTKRKLEVTDDWDKGWNAALEMLASDIQKARGDTSALDAMLAQARAEGIQQECDAWLKAIESVCDIAAEKMTPTTRELVKSAYRSLINQRNAMIAAEAQASAPKKS